jgi:hypothetical protein
VFRFCYFGRADLNARSLPCPGELATDRFLALQCVLLETAASQISPFRAPLSAASTGGVVRHPPRLVPVRIACDRERSGGH